MQSPTASINISERIKPNKPTPQHGLHRQKAGRCPVAQSVFYVMVFAADALALLYFFQMKSVIDKMYLQKNKQVQPTHEAKTHAKKNCLKLH